MNHQDKCEIKKARNVLIASNDPAFNFQFVKNPEDIENFKEQPQIIPMHLYDYGIVCDKGDDMNLPKLCPLSLASCKNNLEDMEAWYAAKFPRLPNEYHGILARYSDGQLLTKKETKNAIKKSKKKNKQLPVGLQVASGNFTVDFN